MFVVGAKGIAIFRLWERIHSRLSRPAVPLRSRINSLLQRQGRAEFVHRVDQYLDAFRIHIRRQAVA